MKVDIPLKKQAEIFCSIQMFFIYRKLRCTSRHFKHEKISIKLVVNLYDWAKIRALSNKSWRQHLTKQQRFNHLPPITKTIQVRRNRHAEHCWRTKDELLSDIILWTPSHGLAKAGRLARTYIQQLCVNTGYSLEDLPGAMDDKEGWRERVREICAGTATWWWWCTPGLKSFQN